MKKLWVLIALVLSASIAFSQTQPTKGYLPYDTVYIGGTVPGSSKVYKGEVIIKNATKDSTGSFLMNVGGGRLRFERVLKKIDSATYLVGLDTLTIPAGGVGGSDAFGAAGIVQLSDGAGNLTGDAVFKLSSNGRLYLGTGYVSNGGNLDSAFIIGSNHTVKANGSLNFIVGRGNIYNGISKSILAGSNDSTASLVNGLVAADNSTIAGTGAVVAGANNTLIGTNGGIIVGSNNVAGNSSAIGQNLQSLWQNALVVGNWNDPTGYSDTRLSGNTSASPIFVLGNGTSTSDKKNALVIFQNGEALAPFYKNNVSEDSVLIPDVNGKLKLKKFAASATAAGSTKQIQWNNSGVLAASSAFTFDNVNNAFNVGTLNVFSSSNNFAVGNSNNFNSTGSGALGNNNTFTGGNNSYAFGSLNTFNTAINSVGIGSTNTIIGDNAIVAGITNQGVADNSLTLGLGTINNSLHGITLGRYNDTAAFSGSSVYAATGSALVIGKGTANGARANALALLNDGTIISDKYKNNVAGDSVLSTDNTGKLIMKLYSAGAESDPTVGAHIKAILSGDITNWNAKIGGGTNGITSSGTNVKLGTALTENTSIPGAGFTFDILGSPAIKFGKSTDTSLSVLSAEILAKHGSNLISIRGDTGIAIQGSKVTIKPTDIVLTNFANNVAEDSVLTVDFVSKKLKMRLASAGGSSDGNNFPSSLGFSGGTLTLGRTGLSSLTVSLDGRYQLAGSYEAPLTFSGPLSRSVNTISIPAATSLVNGYLSSTDWSTFNNKVATTRAVNTTAPLLGGGDLSTNRTLSITQSNTTTDGYLSSTDWNTFNNKVATTRAINTTGPLSGGGNLSADRTLTIAQATTSTDGYLSSVDWNTFNNKQAALTGNVTAGSGKISLGGTPTGAVKNNFSIDIVEGNLTLNNMSGTLNLLKGGTGASTRFGAQVNILPDTAGHTGHYLQYNGTNFDWAAASGGGGGIADPGANGILARTALNTTAARTLTGTGQRIVISNGTGAAGNPTFDIGTDVADIASTQTLQNKIIGQGWRVTMGSDATGDMYYRNATGNLTRIAPGSTGQQLTMGSSSIPTWQAPPASNATSITALRANAAPSTTLPYYITDIGQEGYFYYDATDVTSADNTGTILVSADGKRFKRSYPAGRLYAQWFGAKTGSANAAATVAAINAAKAAAKDWEEIYLGGGDWYINATISFTSTSTKHYNFKCDGNIFVTALVDAFILEGNNPLNFDISPGMLQGANTGGSTTDSVGWTNYVGRGVFMRNLYNSTVKVGIVERFKTGLEMAGYGTGAGNGSQFNRVYFDWVRRNHTQIKIATYDIPSSGNGNFSNESYWYGGQLGIGIPGTTYGGGGWYGLVTTKDASSNAPDYGINGHYFYNFNFEGLQHAIVIDNAYSMKFYSTAIEPEGSHYHISISQTSTDGTMFVNGTTISDRMFVAGRGGVNTKIESTPIWGFKDYGLPTETSYPLGNEAYYSTSLNKLIVSSDKYSTSSAWVTQQGTDLWTKIAERPTVENGQWRINGKIRKGAVKGSYKNVTSTTTADTVLLPNNIGYIRLASNKGYVFQIDVDDMVGDNNQFMVEVVNYFPFSFVRSDNNVQVIASSNFTTTGTYLCTYRSSVWVVAKLGGSGGSGLTSVNISDINATGTPSSTTFLRGDGVWATPAGGGGGSYTISTGLTDNVGTLTNDLSTGKDVTNQNIFGSTQAGGDLTLNSTTNATKGLIFMGTSAYDEVNNRLGIGKTAPTEKLDVVGNGLFNNGTTTTLTSAGSTTGSLIASGSTTNKVEARASTNSEIALMRTGTSGINQISFGNSTTFGSSKQFSIQMNTGSNQLRIFNDNLATATMTWNSGTNQTDVSGLLTLRAVTSTTSSGALLWNPGTVQITSPVANTFQWFADKLMVTTSNSTQHTFLTDLNVANIYNKNWFGNPIEWEYQERSPAKVVSGTGTTVTEADHIVIFSGHTVDVTATLPDPAIAANQGLEFVLVNGTVTAGADVLLSSPARLTSTSTTSSIAPGLNMRIKIIGSQYWKIQ